MRTVLHELQGKIKNIDLVEELREIILETKQDIIKLNQGQLFLGRRSDGTDLAPYSPFYAEFKSKLPHPIASIINRRTLFLTGYWWSRIKVDVKTDTFEVYNDDPKHPAIVQREGQNVLGLSRESKAEYIEYTLKDRLVARIRNKLAV